MAKRTKAKPKEHPLGVPLVELRKQLGQFVMRAALSGETTFITIHGRRCAAIVPLKLLRGKRGISSPD